MGHCNLGRRLIETDIMATAIYSLIKAGYYVAVDYGDGENAHEPTRDFAAIMADMYEADDERLYVYTKEQWEETQSDEVAHGWVYFVYGNDGWDVMSDYTTNLEDVLKPANQLAHMWDSR